MAPRQTGGRVKAAIFLLISLIAAAAASMVIYTVITNFQSQLEIATQPEPLIEVVRAKRDLNQGMSITEEDIDLVELPPAYVPDSVFRSMDEVLGRVPRERILVNEFVRSERLANLEAGAGLEAIIPRGMRAISVNLQGGAVVSGFLNPGNYVDVIVSLRDSENKGVTRTITMLQAVTVLAVNSRLASGDHTRGKSAASVTLAVTPSDGEKLAHASSQGRVTLTLRNDIDVTHVLMHGDLQEDADRIGGDSVARTSISNWQQRKAKSRDGSLLIIRGSDVRKER